MHVYSGLESMGETMVLALDFKCWVCPKLVRALSETRIRKLALSAPLVLPPLRLVPCLSLS